MGSTSVPVCGNHQGPRMSVPACYRNTLPWSYRFVSLLFVVLHRTWELELKPKSSSESQKLA
jgi:hypothetical protein